MILEAGSGAVGPAVSLGRPTNEPELPDTFSRLRSALADRYTIERELGSGGMATVYLAQDRKHHRKVAIKILKPELAAALGPERFLREIEIAAGLTHPHILPLHDSGEADGLLYYVMPFVEGQTLRGRLEREKQLPLEDALAITRDIAEALSYAHSHGVVHRDVKPENILFQVGHAVVSDFGIARAITAAAGGNLTETGIAVGTPAYMSPEQAAGSRELDGRSDIYSLGCVLFEMLAGAPPYAGPTAQAIMARRLTEPVPSLHAVRETVPDAVEQAIGQALARVPADRFATAQQFAEALRSPRASEPIPAAAKSIAVLPFANLSPDPENEYFSDGITEEIINTLAQLPGLHVAARTSSFAFKGKVAEIAEVGAKLKVAIVLEGSVRKVGNRVRITARLINVSDGYHLWSERYDRELHDIFAIQDAIARAIAHRLELALAGPAGVALVSPPTENLSAYELYLKGRYCWNQLGAGFAKGLEYFQQALAVDPNFARAHAGVADAYALLALSGRVAPKDVMPAAKEAAERALAIDDSLAEAHASMGLIHFLHDWDWAAAERELTRAIALNPRYLPACYWYASLCSSRLRWDESVAVSEQAVAMEPLSILSNLNLGMMLLWAGRTTRAIEQLRKVIELEPHFPLAHSLLGCAHASEAHYDDALPLLEEAVKLSNRFPDTVAVLAVGYAEAGRTEEAQQLLGELRARATREYVRALSFAVVCAALGDADETFAWLDKGYAERDVSLPFFGRVALGTGTSGMALPAPLRRDPRYQALQRMVGRE